METDATDDQRALLEVSSRFMEDVCPLRAVRDGVWKDAAFAASYRRQAAELGWFSMLVPEALGGGSVSGNGVLDAALIAYARGALLQPGSFVGTNVVAYADRRGRQRRAAVGRCSGAGGRRGVGVVGRVDGAGRSLRRRRRRPCLDDGGLELTGVEARRAGRRRRRRGCSSPRRPPTAQPRPLVAADAPGRHRRRARLARPHPALRRGPLRRRPGAARQPSARR